MALRFNVGWILLTDLFGEVHVSVGWISLGCFHNTMMSPTLWVGVLFCLVGLWSTNNARPTQLNWDTSRPCRPSDIINYQTDSIYSPPTLLWTNRCLHKIQQNDFWCTVWSLCLFLSVCFCLSLSLPLFLFLESPTWIPFLPHKQFILQWHPDFFSDVHLRKSNKNQTKPKQTRCNGISP